MSVAAAAHRPLFHQSSATPVPPPSHLSLREAICQTCDTSRNLLGLMALSNSAQRDLDSGRPEVTLDGVVSKAVLRSLLGALQYRDIATLKHSRRVALLSVGLATHLGWEGRDLRVLEVAALLHDVGKIGVPDSVLYKPGKLNRDEVGLMSLHYRVGLCVLQACRVDPRVLQFVDESYRANDPGEADVQSIRSNHMGARILAVADAYESLFTAKVYRPARSHEEILHLMESKAGSQFDRDIVNALARWVQQDGLPFAAQAAELHELGQNQPPFSVEEAAESMALCQIFSYLYVLESLYDGFHIVGADRKFVVWSRGAERLIEHSAQKMLGQVWNPRFCAILSGNQEPNSTGSSVEDAIKAGRAMITQLPFRKNDGAEVQLEVQTVPLFDSRGNLHGVAEIFHNLTRKTHEPELRQLQIQASRDALTSVANRGELEKQLQNLVEEYQEDPSEPFCVIFADADHFKRVNDAYGHQTGDQVLIDLAKHFTDETYSGEIVGRYGGEEFVILCPGTDLANAVRRAERLRNSLRNTKVGGVANLKLTCSFGVAQIEPGDLGEAIVARADRALYAAKEAGRDRTCSLMRAQLEASEVGETKRDSKCTFEFSSSFSAFIGSEMVFYKLGGFISAHKAHVADASPERVVVDLSGAGLAGYFGSSPSRQGVQIELLMYDSARSGSPLNVRINVKMRSLGWYRNGKAFEARTQILMRELKKYFAAE